MKNNILKLKNIPNWYIIDAKKQILGRLATKIAKMLMGKHKAEYTPNLDFGDYIIVLNSLKVIVTGTKYKNKIYHRYSGYIGGMKKITFQNMMFNNSNNVIKYAVKGMLPKGPLGNKMYKKLKVFKDNNHKHIAQQPKILKI